MRRPGPAIPTAMRASLIESPLQEPASLLNRRPDRFEPLLATVPRVAGKIVREFGACRVQANVGRGNDRVRWQLFAPIQ